MQYCASYDRSSPVKTTLLFKRCAEQSSSTTHNALLSYPATIIAMAHQPENIFKVATGSHWAIIGAGAAFVVRLFVANQPRPRQACAKPMAPG